MSDSITFPSALGIPLAERRQLHDRAYLEDWSRENDVYLQQLALRDPTAVLERPLRPRRRPKRRSGESRNGDDE